MTAPLTPLQQALVARLSAAEGEPRPPVSDLLQDALGDNPHAAPLLAALRRREEAEARAVTAADALDDLHDGLHDEAAEPVATQPPQLARDLPAALPQLPQLPQAADVLERLYDEVEELRLRVRTLAAALGACARCWGEDPGCPRCAGRGRPGGRRPDALLYHEYVTPAVRRRAAHERALDQGTPARS